MKVRVLKEQACPPAGETDGRDLANRAWGSVRWVGAAKAARADHVQSWCGFNWRSGLVVAISRNGHSCSHWSGQLDPIAIAQGFPEGSAAREPPALFATWRATEVEAERRRAGRGSRSAATRAPARRGGLKVAVSSDGLYRPGIGESACRAAGGWP